jgi:hypothetical protein
MEILVALGRIFEASDLVPVVSAQISGISYKNIGPHGLAFLRDWADQGARVRVPAFMNPGGLDRELWAELGIGPGFAARQSEVVAQLERMGVVPLLSCTPYHVYSAPQPGDHLAWAESSAVAYANSVLGARTNREGGPSAIAAAIAGRTPRHGLHTDEGRRAQLIVRVALRDLRDPADFGALGHIVGKLAGGDPPLFEDLHLPDEAPVRTAALKALGAAMAASGSVGLFHIAGVTPDAVADPRGIIHPAARSVAIDDIEAARRELGAAPGQVDLVFLGCPHLSLEELDWIAERLAGKRLRARLWLTTAQQVREEARVRGIAQRLRKAGATLLADTCMVVAPLAEMNVRAVATNSAKVAAYIPSHQGVPVYFGSTEDCLRAAEEGQWP